MAQIAVEKKAGTFFLGALFFAGAGLPLFFGGMM